MEKKSNKLTIGIIILIVIVLLVGIFAVVNRGDSTSADQEITENVTDMDALKNSEYTNEGFDEVNLGDSKSDVESKMGKLTKVDIESEFDIYGVEDQGTVYYFYFNGDKLENVSVFLDE